MTGNDAELRPRATPQPPSTPIGRALALLEFVAERGHTTAKEIADALDLPLPTVYRIAGSLVEADSIVHLRSEGEFEMGYKVHQLAVSLHRRMAVPKDVLGEIGRLHHDTGMAAYWAPVRGPELVLAHVVDSPRCPRIHAMRFGFHEMPHATAFGKILLAETDDRGRDEYLSRHGLRMLTPHTITDRDALDDELGEVGRRGLAWEWEEFVPGTACAAVPVRDGRAELLGSVAISAPPGWFEEATKHRMVSKLRQVAARTASILQRS
ncbi:MAG: IclR family transcriptional regulator [Pseudoclavibacter sp.]